MRRYERLLALLALAAGCAPRPVSAVVIDIPAPSALADEGGRAATGPIADRFDLLGRWVGVAQQSGGLSWEIEVEVEGLGPGVCAHAVYPSIPCAAEWTCLDASNRGALHAREHVTEGQDACIEGGEMTLALTREGRLAWSWTGAGERAHASLSRAAPRL